MSYSYRVLLIKAVVFVLLFVACDWLFGVFCRWLEFRGLNNNRQEFLAEYTLYEANEDVLIIGASEASHSYVSNIISDSLGLSVYNTGNDGQFFYYQNAMINGVLDRYRPKLIIWSMEPSFLSNEPLAKQRISALKPFWKDNKYCAKLLELKSKYERIKVLSNCYVYNSLIFNYLRCGLGGSVNDNENGFSPLKKADNPPQLIKPDFISSTEADDEYVNILNATLRRLQQEGVPLIFVFTPMYFDDYDYTKMNYYKKLIEIIDSYNNCRLVDDFYLNETFMDSSLYKDNGHLDYEGAVYFSSELSSLLKKNVKL